MKKIIPHVLTSLITILIVFSGIYVYDNFFDKKDLQLSDTISDEITTNVNTTKSDNSKSTVIYTSASDSIKNSVEKIYDSVVLIEVSSGQTSGSGTGFVYKKDNKKGYILTNYHVIEDSTKVEVTFTSGEKVTATILGTDQYYDIAVLSVDVSSVISVAEIGSSKEASIGDTVFTVGSPLGSNYMGTVTKGVLSGKDRQVTVKSSDNSYNIMEVLQTDAAINPGNSGGPLANINGEVIGITSLKLVEEQVEGMGFTIPIELVMSCVDSLEKGETIKRPYLGVSTASLSSRSYLSRYNIHIPSDITTGAVIISVEEGSSASEVGLKVGDVILSIDGEEVKDTTYLKYVLYKHKIGDKVTIKYYRDNKVNQVEVTLNKSSNSSLS